MIWMQHITVSGSFWPFLSICLLLIDSLLFWKIIKLTQAHSSFSHPITSFVKQLIDGFSLDMMAFIFILYILCFGLGLALPFIMIGLVLIQSLSLMSNMFVLAIIISQSNS